VRYRTAMPTLAVPRAAMALAALGHEARLEIFRALVRAGDDGLPVYLIQERLGGMPRSTLAHHLQALVQAGLVAQHKVGAEVVSRAEFAEMRGLVAYLTDECCAEVEACAPEAADAPERGRASARRTPAP
jgi:ArsR family transcriptional regulator, arsenate/arsenite/antimonite-responsive transcriptional repressor